VSSEVKWRGEPLPRGRHKLPSATVRDSQRARIVRAMLECVARDGYEPTTVPQVVATARVSRNAFYEFFADKADCFIAVCDQTGEEMLAELLELAAEPDWVHALQEGMQRYLRWWQERPTISSAYLLYLPTVGERALRQRERQYAAFRAMFADLARRARVEQPELGPVSELAPRVLVLAITELVAEEVRAGRTARLTELSDEMSFLAIKLLADEATAKRARDAAARSHHEAGIARGGSTRAS
jgi:AcrR family transcriptional regulator